MNETNNSLEQPQAGDLVCFYNWLKSINKTRGTGWNYRRRGWIETINIAGSLYISREEIARFEKRAKAGEFACTRNVSFATGKKVGATA